MSLTEITRAQAREIDRRAIAAGMSSLVLMENAARGAVDTLARLGIAGPVLICCGPGNNGGDGLAMARLLDARGYEVRLALWGHDDKLSADAAANLRLIPHTGVSLTRFAAKDLTQFEAHIQGVDWIVDALFGTGFRGAPRAPIEEVIRSINAASSKKLAVDLPSGLDADTGQPAEPTIHAQHTVTFVAPKIGFRNPAAIACVGEVHVVDIGAPRRIVEDVLAGR